MNSVNPLLKLSFQRAGYDAAYLTEISRDCYGDGFLFPGEQELILALAEMREQGDQVTVFPDYDMDGIASGCIFYAGLSLLGMRVNLFCPDVTKGYGMHPEDIDLLCAKFPGTAAVLTCDTGISEHAAIDAAHVRGLRVFVTDHHLEQELCRGDICVDPCRKGLETEFDGVCGSWVAWHVVRTFAALDAAAGNGDLRDAAERLVLFAGLGSCGDAMPVIHDTRHAIRGSLVEFGRLADCGGDMDMYFDRDASGLPPTFTAVFENLFFLDGFLVSTGRRQEGEITADTYRFLYCPLFNSVKRMGENLQNLYDLLYTVWDPEDGRRLELCRWLGNLNDERKELTARRSRELREDRRQVLRPWIWLCEDGSGMLGLLAGDLMRRNGEPCVVMHWDGERQCWSGSGRTPDWFDGRDAFSGEGICAAGHEHAFGIRVTDGAMEHLYLAMRERSRSEKARTASGRARAAASRVRIALSPELGDADGYDFVIRNFEDVDICRDLAEVCAEIGPFGRGFEEPSFLLDFPFADVAWQGRMGSDGQHMKIRLDAGFEIVWFSGADWLENLSGLDREEDAGRRFVLTGTFQINRYMGADRLQFRADGAL